MNKFIKTMSSKLKIKNIRSWCKNYKFDQKSVIKYGAIVVGVVVGVIVVCSLYDMAGISKIKAQIADVDQQLEEGRKARDKAIRSIKRNNQKIQNARDNDEISLAEERRIIRSSRAQIRQSRQARNRMVKKLKALNKQKQALMDQLEE